MLKKTYRYYNLSAKIQRLLLDRANLKRKKCNFPIVIHIAGDGGTVATRLHHTRCISNRNNITFE